MNYGNISDNNLHPCNYTSPPPPAIQRESWGNASASILKKFPVDRYKLINALLLTSNGYSTQIDHIVISIYGVFVIETKFYQGWIYGGENNEYWTQNIYGNKYQLRNPIHQNQGHIRALKFLLKDYGNIPFISIVSFSRQGSHGIDAHSPVIYWVQIPRIINLFETRVLSESQIQSIYNPLLANNVEDKTAKKQHISNVRHNEIKRDIAVANGYCPQCGGTLTLRQGKYGKFYGYSNYPRCKYTTPYI